MYIIRIPQTRRKGRLSMKIGFLGTGNMGGALARAIDRHHDDVTFLLADPDSEKAGALASSLRNGSALVSNSDAAGESDYLFFAVKPQKLAEAVSPLRETIVSRKQPPVIVSMAAGVAIETIDTLTGGRCAVIRIMPNTPVSLDEGVIGYATKNVSPDEERIFLDFFEKSALLVSLPEEKIDGVCALSGCGPAFVYSFLRSLAQGGVSAGLSGEDALRMACQTAKGAAEMILRSGTDPATLIKNVCSPGGATLAGMGVLENAHFEDTIQAAVDAAYKRTIELGK